jgi:hypothetical protein
MSCNDLIAFADGELDNERAAAFRVHLADCATCQSELVETEQLSARLSTLSEDTRPERIDVPNCAGCPFYRVMTLLCTLVPTGAPESLVLVAPVTPPPDWCPLRKADRLVTLRLR